MTRGRPADIPRPGPGQESVWDYPRPPRVEDSTQHIEVRLDGVVIADTRRAKRVCETGTPPAYYILPGDVLVPEYLVPSKRRTVCEWKGTASYYDVRVGSKVLHAAAWYYPEPTPGYEASRGFIAFYPHQLECFVNRERVLAQAGTFYGGWITQEIVGPFKGPPGTENW